MSLRNDVKFGAFDAQLAEKEVQRGGAVGFGGDVGHCVEANVNAVAIAEIEAVQAAWNGVAFEDSHALPEMREADSSAEP